MAKSRRSALGAKYQSAFMAGRDESTPATPALPGKDGARKAYKPVTRPKVTLYLRPDVLESARDAAQWLIAKMTLTALVEQAIEEKVSRLAKQYHGGKPFPKRDQAEPLRRGSRVKPR